MSQITYYGTGRRKTAAARVFMRPGAGEVKVNGRTLDNYFPNEVLKMVIKQPFLVTETTEKFDVVAKVEGRTFRVSLPFSRWVRNDGRRCLWVIC